MLTVSEFKTFVRLQRPTTHMKKRGKQDIAYFDDFATYDCEVSTIPGPELKACKGLLYIWQVCIFGHTVYGRTLDEFKDFALFLYKKLGLNYKNRLVMFVHNLEYDFTFFSGLFNWKEVFATNTRSILFGYAYGIEFRCSYKLTNMSLSKFAEQMQVEHQKLSGDDFDYRAIRTPDTELTEEQMEYCENDVLGLYEGIQKKLTADGDNIATMPYTSTGYVRRDCRNAMRSNRNNRALFERTRLSPHLYTMSKKAFRGGNCHANRERAGKIEKNVVSFDIASSYPSVLMYEKYACKPFRRIDIKSVQELKYIFDHEYACLFDITLIKPRTEGSIPYIPIDKCEELSGFVNDNGRVLKADRLRLICNEDDLYIILDSYEKDAIIFNESWIAETDYLPIELRRVISHYFEEKTTYKGVEGKEYYYAKMKNLFNAIFGMTVQDPVHPIIKYDKGIWSSQKADTVKSLDNFYDNPQSFLPYQWGVAVTSKARRRLHEAIKIIDAGRPAKLSPMYYCDTDSVKFLYDKSIMDQISAINDRIRKKAESCPVKAIAYTRKNEEQVLGLWDFEETYDKFVSFGAKKYAYEGGKKGGFHITVSGLNKEKGAKEIGCIENFKIGLTVKDAGRTISVYDDNIKPHYVTVNGKDYKIYGNIAILDTTYTLGVTPEYGELAPNIFTGSIYDEEVAL